MMFHPKMKYLYVGIDSHKETHTAVFLTCFYEKLGEITFQNVPSEFPKFLSEVRKHASNDIDLSFGLEDVSAYGRKLASFLKSKGFIVKHVNAGLVAHERKSMNVLQKTDSFDAECAARVLLNRFDSLPDVNLQDKYWTLQELVTRRKALIKMNVSLKNQLQTYVPQSYPSCNKFFSDICCESGLAFFEKYSSPSKLESVTPEEIVKLLMNNGRSSHKESKAKLILECVKKDGVTTTEYQELRDSIIVSIIRQIRLNTKEIDIVDESIKGFLKEFDYKLQTMRGINFVTAASLIAEIGDIERFETPAKLAKYAGVSPVTYASGKSEVQFANSRGNRILNQTFFCLAVTLIGTSGIQSRIINPYFYDYYKKKISEGKTKKQALKCVQRRLVNIIWGMMKNKTEYVNPETLKYVDSKKSQ